MTSGCYHQSARHLPKAKGDFAPAASKPLLPEVAVLSFHSFLLLWRSIALVHDAQGQL
jgi:hypothetical protein